LDYAIVRYENVIRGIIPITQELYSLMAFDIELIEFDEIIAKRLIPLVKRYAKERNKIFIRLPLIFRICWIMNS
jgi:hypothetical protein